MLTWENSPILGTAAIMEKLQVGWDFHISFVRSLLIKDHLVLKLVDLPVVPSSLLSLY